MRFFILFAPFAFLILWQEFILAFLLMLLPFYALYSEFFIVLRAKKSIIKKATLKQNALFYRLSKSHNYARILAFILAVLSLVSLILNLLVFDFVDIVFVFIVFPCVFALMSMLLKSQLKNHPYNILKFVFFASLPCALLYGGSQWYFREESEAFLYLKEHIFDYKTSSFAPLEFILQSLNLIISFKNFLLFWVDAKGFELVIFVFDSLNFLSLGFIFGLIYSFVFKEKFEFIFCLIFGIVLFFVYEQRRNKDNTYAQNLLSLIDNVKEERFLKDLNTSILENQKSALLEQLLHMRKILDKNAFEISIWWFSDERKEMKEKIDRLKDAI